MVMLAYPTESGGVCHFAAHVSLGDIHSSHTRFRFILCCCDRIRSAFIELSKRLSSDKDMIKPPYITLGSS